MYEREGACATRSWHLLLDVPPRLAPSRVMQAIKGKTSHHLLQDHRKLRKEFWGRHLWARGYFVATTGNVSDTMVAEYIKPKMSRPETTIFGSLSSQPASEARSLGDFSRMSNPPPSGGGEWDPSQESALGHQRIREQANGLIGSYSRQSRAVDEQVVAGLL